MDKGENGQRQEMTPRETKKSLDEREAYNLYSLRERTFGNCLSESECMDGQLAA